MNKKKISKKGKMNRFFLFLSITFLFYLLIANSFKHQKELVSKNESHVANLKKAQVSLDPNTSKRLDVPLLNQMDAPLLYNGCEVTSLAMILNYAGNDVSKNQLADSLTTVPFLYDDGNYGDPNEGFVGSISGETVGYSVYHQPIFNLAKEFAKNPQGVLDLTGESFEQILLEVNAGHPVWTITTVTYAPTNDMEEWETPNGPVNISWNVHSVVITGFDSKNIYLNDPYGEKDKAVNRTDFQGAWEQMGNQAVIIN